MNNTLISCIIPTYNRALYLKDAIESTIVQTYPFWELIIIDDGSTDNTEQVVDKYLKKDHRIKYYENPGKGGSSARNYGLNKAKGEYIAFLDDDDVSLPHRFKSQLTAAIKSKSNFIVSGYEIRERVTNVVKHRAKLELKGNGAGFPSRWLLKKDLLEKVKGFDEEFPSMQDIELSYRLAEHEIFTLHDDIVSILYNTNNSVSGSKVNAIKGKVLLMERLSNKMNFVEAAWWHYNIGRSYYSLGEKQFAVNYLKKSCELDARLSYKIACFFCTFSPIRSKIFRWLNLMILNITGGNRFPLIVRHPVV